MEHYGAATATNKRHESHCQAKHPRKCAHRCLSGRLLNGGLLVEVVEDTLKHTALLAQRQEVSNNRARSIGGSYTLSRFFVTAYPPAQERHHESIKVAVEHRLDVAGFQARPQIFDQIVGMKDVIADLTAEVGGDELST